PKNTGGLGKNERNTADSSRVGKGVHVTDAARHRQENPPACYEDVISPPRPGVGRDPGLTSVSASVNTASVTTPARPVSPMSRGWPPATTTGIRAPRALIAPWN